MNLYFLVEGDETESYVYPRWLAHLLPNHRRVTSPDQASANCYYLVSGQGYPGMLQRVSPAAEDVAEHGGYDWLVFCADVEDEDPAEKRAAVQEVVNNLHPALPRRVQFCIVLQQRCMESWFLGNGALVPSHPACPVLRGYIADYDVSSRCPEAMGGRPNFPTAAAFHQDYLRRLFREHRLTYSKRRPAEVTELYYLERLHHRASATSHLGTFSELLTLCRQVRAYSVGYETVDIPF